MLSIPTFDLQQNTIEDKNKNFKEKIKENSNSFQKDKQKRRSRHYIEGRKFECESCLSFSSTSVSIWKVFQRSSLNFFAVTSVSVWMCTL